MLVFQHVLLFSGEIIDDHKTYFRLIKKAVTKVKGVKGKIDIFATKVSVEDFYGSFLHALGVSLVTFMDVGL